MTILDIIKNFNRIQKKYDRKMLLIEKLKGKMKYKK